MKDRIRKAALRWLSVGLMVVQLLVLSMFVVACGSSNSSSPVAVAPPQGVQGVASPVAASSGSPVPVATSSVAVGSPDPVASLRAVPSIVPSGTLGIVPALSTADPVEGTLNDDELQQMLFGSEGSAVSLAVNPVGRFLILNQSVIDGQALVFGQSLPLQVQALDSQGVDISAEVEWVDITNRRWGTGKSITYVAGSESRMETIQARLRGKIERVSFTVSPPDVIVAKSVKVFPDSSAYRISKVEQGSIELTPDKTMPTIRVGDVVIGAKGSVPPAKVTGAQVIGSGKVKLLVRAALPKELIEKGTATFEQQVDWSGSTPAGGVEIVNIPPTPFHIADILSPKWSGFVKAGDPIQKGLKVTASARLDWKPTYKGTIKFEKNSNTGLRSLYIEQSSDFFTKVDLQAKGFSEWQNKFSMENVLTIQNKSLNLLMGPVPIRLALKRNDSLKFFPQAKVTSQAITTFSYNLRVSESIIFDSQSQKPWSFKVVKSTGSGNGSIQDSSDLYGSILVSFTPKVLMSLTGDSTIETGWKSYQLFGGFPEEKLSTLDETENSQKFKVNVKSKYKRFSLGGIRYSYLEIPSISLNSIPLASSSSETPSKFIQLSQNDPCQPRRNCPPGVERFFCVLWPVLLTVCNNIADGNLLTLFICFAVLVAPPFFMCIWCYAVPPSGSMAVMAKSVSNSIETVKQAYDSGNVKFDIEEMSELTGISGREIQTQFEKFIADNGNTLIKDIPAKLLGDLTRSLSEIQDSGIKEILEAAQNYLSQILGG